MACSVPLGRKGYSARKIHYLYINKICVLHLAELEVTEHRVTWFSNIFIFHGSYFIKTSRNIKHWVLNNLIAVTLFFFSIHIPNPTQTRLSIFSHFHFYFLCLSILPSPLFPFYSWSRPLHDNLKYFYNLNNI